jgi:hypothetical protein
MDNHSKPTTASVSGITTSPSVEIAAPANQQQIAALAYEFWKNRGCPEGTPEEDWFRAERELAESTKTDETEVANRNPAERPIAHAEVVDPSTLRFPERSEVLRAVSGRA